MNLGMRPFGSEHTYMSESSEQYFRNEAAEKAKKAADLQAKIQERLSKKPGLVSL